MKRLNFNVPLEVRNVDVEQGIFEGYASVFDTVDSYGSKIMPGAFAKTLSERADKIKVLWNHDDDAPIGRPIDMREDAHGLWVRAQITRGIQKGEEALLLMRDGVINTLSIGFSVPRGKDKIVDGVRQISEVKLYEFSPVTFEANEDAKIHSVRATDFNESLEDVKNEATHEQLIESLEGTLMDCWWGPYLDTLTEAEVLPAINKAVDDFAEQYKAYAAAYVPQVYPESDSEQRADAPSINALSAAVLQHMRSEGHRMIDVASNTSLTVDGIRSAMRGKMVDNKIITELGDDVTAACRKQHRENIEAIATELRGDLNAAERNQFSALLGLQPEQSTESDPAADSSEPQSALTDILAEVRKFNS